MTKSVDDGITWTPFTVAATPIENPNGYFPPTNFRDGIIENFAASPTFPGHVYLTYENWDPVANHFDVFFTQSTDGGLTWSAPSLVNDDGAPSTDQFQPSVAAGPGGAVAVAFYDRREPCPSDPSIIPAHVGAANTCINVSLQPYKDSGTAAGAVPVGGNVRVSQFAWDPDQPAQKVDGISQYPCAGHIDPCPTGRGFIGDYFGLAISNSNIYTLVRLHPLPGRGRDRGRRRTRLLPAASAGQGSALHFRRGLLIGSQKARARTVGCAPRPIVRLAAERQRGGHDVFAQPEVDHGLPPVGPHGPHHAVERGDALVIAVLVAEVHAGARRSRRSERSRPPGGVRRAASVERASV